MRLANVVGTRPQLIKAAAAWPALVRRHEPLLVDTGQHYDDEMAGRFFDELRLPRPDRELHVGGLSRAAALATILARLEPTLAELRPEAVIVYGDTTSTLAGALAAVALDLPLVHVEAGQRSRDRSMPEEQNRVVVDHLASLLFATGPEPVANLAGEGIVDEADRRVVAVGDLMQDLCAAALPEARDTGLLAPFGLAPGRYLFATVHRAENRVPEAIHDWVALLDALAREPAANNAGPWPVVLALHPGTREAIDLAGVPLPTSVRTVPPQGYRTTLALQLHAAAVVTDSGGVQREAAWLGVPALVLRETTEWPATLEAEGGRSALVGRDIARARAALGRLASPADSPAAAERRAREAHVPPSGAAEAIALELERWCGAA